MNGLNVININLIELDLNGKTYEEIIIFLYYFYKKDLKDCKLFYNNKIVNTNYRGEFINGKEERFWHIIEKDCDNKRIDGDRLIDFARAKKIHWIRPILTKYFKDSSIKIFKDEIITKKSNGKNKKVKLEFIWFKEGKYLIILEERKNEYILKTAYNVEPWKEKQLETKYNDYLKKQSYPVR